MTSSAEQIQIFYEISISIGSSLDLRKMAKTTLSTYLKKLNCSAGCILQKKATNVEKVYAIPRKIESIDIFRETMDKFIHSFDKTNQMQSLPFIYESENNQICYVMNLPDFGFLFLITSGDAYNEYIINSIKQINIKLAGACLACIQNEALRESEEKFRSIFEQFQDLYYQTDLNGIIKAVSPSVKILTGYEPDELIGKSVSNVYHDPAERTKFFTELKKSGRITNYELKLVKKNGNIADTSINSHIVFGKDNKPVTVDGVIRDITERKKAEEELIKHHDNLDELVAERTAELHRLDLAIRNSPVSIIITDIKGGVIYINPAFTEITSYTEKEIIGNNIKNFKTNKDSYKFFKQFINVINSKQSWQGELSGKSKNKKTVALSTSISLVRDRSGNISNFVAVSENITKRKKAEELIRESDRLRSIETGRAQLSAMVLHNIGNAVTPVVVQLSKIKNDSLRQTTGYMEKCYHELNNHISNLTDYVTKDKKGNQVFTYLGKLIDSLNIYEKKTKNIIMQMDSTVSYISESISLQQKYAAQEQESKQVINLNDLIEDAIRMQINSIESRGIVLYRELAPDLPPMMIEKNKFMQVLINFIKNGYESLDEQKDNNIEKSMTFKTGVINGKTILEIYDTGIGIEPKKIENLFRFGKSNKGSSGVGLYYCKTFIEGNGGSLKLNSPGKGKGVKILVKFNNNGLEKNKE